MNSNTIAPRRLRQRGVSPGREDLSGFLVALGHPVPGFHECLVIDNAGAQVLTMLKPSRSCQVHRARLERMSQLRDKNPVRQYWQRWLHFPGHRGGNRDAVVKLAQQIEAANLSELDEREMTGSQARLLSATSACHSSSVNRK